MSLGINTKSSAAGAASRVVERMPIEKPIFITGLGRSGTTIIHTFLSRHPNTNWLSLLCGRYPAQPRWNRWLMHWIDVPVVNILLKRRFVPLENYAFWDLHFGGFCLPCRDLFASDVSARNKRTLRKAMSELLTAKRHRLLIKITGFPRISFLHEIFPDGKFIHVTRDGRAVANSRITANFWNGWQGPEQWVGGFLKPEYQREWDRHGRSFVALAGIEWKTHIDQFEHVRREFPHIPIMEVKYEDFCGDPVRQSKEMADFCELPWNEKFEADIRSFHVDSENDKWKKDLTEQQKAILNDVLAPYLPKYGYELKATSAPAPATQKPESVVRALS
jgi:omega-hydroxy-beta-dihydromenaquinone-9 sulfotransferase